MPAPHQREEALFTLAVAKPAAERAAFLDRECAGDPALRQGVEALVLSLRRNVRRITPRGWNCIRRTNLAGSMETPKGSCIHNFGLLGAKMSNYRTVDPPAKGGYDPQNACKHGRPIMPY